jgi:hypothetical protein
MRILIVALGLCAASALLQACAHASSAAAPCALEPGDSVYSKSAAVYRPCAVERKAQSTSTDIHPDLSAMPAQTGRGSRCYSADIEFVVDPRGVPEAATARVVRTNNQDFADAWLKVLPRLRYDPAMLKGEPVRQIVTEHWAAATSTVLVRAGSPPPSSASVMGSAARPAC